MPTTATHREAKNALFDGFGRLPPRGTHVNYRLASDKVLEVWLAIRELTAEQLHDLDALADAYLGVRTQIEAIDRDELLDRLETGDLVLIDVRPTSEAERPHRDAQLSFLDDAPPSTSARNGRTPAGRPLGPSTGVPGCARWEGFEPPAA